MDWRGSNPSPRRIAFQVLWRLITDACHDIEWVDSSDCGPGDENKAIDACLNFCKGDAETKLKVIAYDEIKALMKAIGEKQ